MKVKQYLEKDIYPGQKSINDLRLIEYNNGLSKIINWLDDTTNEPSKFRIGNWVEINDESRGMYNKSNQTRFETSIIISNLCDYIDA